MGIVVSLTAATICFAGVCHPVLIGQQTPVGVYETVHARVLEPGYGGDVLAFGQRRDGRPLAIHRTYTGLPKQRRAERLQSADPSVRQNITGGCINVDPKVYTALVECCAGQSLTIEP